MGASTGVGIVVMAAGLLTGLLTTVGLMAPTAQPVPAEKFEPVRHPTHEAEHRLCHGYNSCRSDGYTDAGYRRHRGRSFWKMYAGANCTNFVAYKLVRAGMPNHRPREHGHRPGNLNAYRWGVVYRSITDHRPTAGSVAWWAHRGRDGHVAWVENINRDGSLTISEDSWSGNGFDWRRLYHGAGWPTGFIHFRHRPVLPGHDHHVPVRPAPQQTRTLDLQAGSITLVSGPAVADPAEPPVAHPVSAPEPHLKPR
ncbi:MAG TPA: CHAP domain-containing protein [Sporichthyaceae bacterium]|nr:CHAP domain-containing protein [Sporichthyaceae bacterium]